MKKLVIFDLDGTLVDSIYDLAESSNFALRNAGLPENSLEEYYGFVGNGMECLIRNAMKEKGDDQELYLKIRKDFDDYYHQHSNDKTVAYEGMGDLLLKLRNENIACAVLTNKAEEYVNGIVQNCFPDYVFSAAWGQQPGIPRKPDAEGLLRLIGELGFSVSDCVFVGDSEVDVETAKHAGMDLICVLWGFRSESQLRAAGAINMVSNAQELFENIISM